MISPDILELHILRHPCISGMSLSITNLPPTNPLQERTHHMIMISRCGCHIQGTWPQLECWVALHNRLIRPCAIRHNLNIQLRSNKALLISHTSVTCVSHSSITCFWWRVQTLRKWNTNHYTERIQCSLVWHGIISWMTQVLLEVRIVR